MGLRPAYRADIQVLRAIAVTMVVLYHLGSRLPSGFLGVDVFFVISGFVIGGLLLSELEEHGRIRLSMNTPLVHPARSAN